MDIGAADEGEAPAADDFFRPLQTLFPAPVTGDMFTVPGDGRKR